MGKTTARPQCPSQTAIRGTARTVLAVYTSGEFQDPRYTIEAHPSGSNSGGLFNEFANLCYITSSAFSKRRKSRSRTESIIGSWLMQKTFRKPNIQTKHFSTPCCPQTLFSSVRVMKGRWTCLWIGSFITNAAQPAQGIACAECRLLDHAKLNPRQYWLRGRRSAQGRDRQS
jgi:hypothetical protein